MKFTKNIDYIQLAMMVNTWDQDRKYVVSRYRSLITDLAKSNYDIESAKNFLIRYKSDPDAITKQYGAQQTAVMYRHAVDMLKTAKIFRDTTICSISSVKKAVKRNTIFALKIRRARQWTNDIISGIMIDNNPNLDKASFHTSREWRDAVNNVKKSIGIKFEWNDPMEYTNSKQSIKVTMTIKAGVYTKEF